jgi:hypothetical protein
MKRAASILVILLILGSATGITIDRHFCGGHVVDVRLAIGDRKAACGMEEDGMVCTGTALFRKNCCHNEMSKFSVGDYSIASILMIDKPLSPVTDILRPAPEACLFNSLKDPLTFNYTGPPGSGLFLTDQQSTLCIFRI